MSIMLISGLSGFTCSLDWSGRNRHNESAVSMIGLACEFRLENKIMNMPFVHDIIIN